MNQRSTLNVKLPNSQLNKWTLGIKNGIEITLNLSSNLIGNSNENNLTRLIFDINYF